MKKQKPVGPVVHKISDSHPHPVEISLIPNHAFGAFDLCVMVGNFKTEDDAERFASQVVDVLNAEGMQLRTPAASDYQSN